MSHRKLTSNNTPARFFMVLALLFMLGAQVLESAHNHTGSESVASCVLSHSGAGTALLVRVPDVPSFVTAKTQRVSSPIEVKLSVVSTVHLPRGPPSNA